MQGRQFRKWWLRLIADVQTHCVFTFLPYMGLQRAGQHNISGSSESLKSIPIWRPFGYSLECGKSLQFSASAILCLVLSLVQFRSFPPKTRFTVRRRSLLSSPFRPRCIVQRNGYYGLDRGWPFWDTHYTTPLSLKITNISPFPSYFFSAFMFGRLWKAYRVAFGSLM